MNNRDNIAKAFDSNLKEPEMYKLWEKSGLSKPENYEKHLMQTGRVVNKPFVMALPPPNANGDLHIGHVCGYSYHDLFGRYNRLKNSPVLLLPGKDHAGIQTESVFTKILQEQGVDKWALGREEFYKRCYEFCTEKANNAREQEKRLGLSADFSREFFTLDPRLTKIVYETFYMLLKDGLVYRGKRIINQCPKDKTALADVDTEHVEMPGIFAYIVYPFMDEADNDLAEKELGARGITVATTRPETMLGDTAVAVNPNDKRYKKFIGHMVKLPIAEREIPVIGEESVDIELGTGALKVTPAHSPIDYEIGKRHNLEVINVIGPDGTMVKPAPERFIGMKGIDCSKALVKELDEMKLLVKIERIKHEVQVCERCKTPIEPIISNQWYVNMKPLAAKALEALKNGDVKVIPHGSQIALQKFYENIQDWCISRQLWWGQRIPVWYSGGKEMYDWLNDNEGKTVADYEKETAKKATGTGKLYAGEEEPKSDDGEIWEAETDLFDTWFSSGQWPFSTLGGPEGDDFKKYFPTDVMVHARDILFWWSARMLMLGLYRTGKAPFKTVFLTGMILAPDGQKMSKSKGNGVTPKEMIDKYGADALRLWYYIDSLPGANSPLREEKIKGNRNFVNKIWNASRFILMNIEDEEIPAIVKKMGEISVKDQEVSIKEENAEVALEGSFAETGISRTLQNTNKVMNYLARFKINLGADEIREFFWHQICDVWIEEVKKELAGEAVGSEKRIEMLAKLMFAVQSYLKVMHPFIPFVTEAVWQEFVTLDLAEGVLMGKSV